MMARAGPRAVRALAGIAAMPTAMMQLNTVPPKSEDTTIAISRLGIALNTSRIRMTMLSTRPP